MASSSAPFSSAPAASVTACHALQFRGVNVSAAPLATARFVSPELRPTVTATSAPGATFRRT